MGDGHVAELEVSSPDRKNLKQQREEAAHNSLHS